MKLKPWLKNVLSCLVILAGGFVLFTLAFLLAALVINTTMSVMGISENEAPPAVGRAIFLSLILLISWAILKSRLHTLVKATFLTMPLMVILVFVGIQFYQQPIWISIGIGAMIAGIVLIYIYYKKKLSWLYYFSTVYVAVLALFVALFHVQI